MRLIKAIVIDSHPDVVHQLTKFAEENAVILDICAFSDDLKASIPLIQAHKPELLFIAPTAANLASFDLLKGLDFNIPKFIFISADTNNAYDAYRYNAVDFHNTLTQPSGDRSNIT